MSLLDPPAPARVVEAGAPRGAAQRAGVLIHGRDRTPEEMIGLAAGLELDRVRWLAPTVEGGSWYPGRFFDPIAANAPHISRAFEMFDQVIEDASEGGRLPPSQIIVMGFSQGACLALEYTVRNLGRSRNIVAFTGRAVRLSWGTVACLSTSPIAHPGSAHGERLRRLGTGRTRSRISPSSIGPGR